jgi:hypothetical protein
MIGGYAENKQDVSDRQWPETIAAAKVIKNRCADCHDKFLKLPMAISDNHDIPPWTSNPPYVPRHLIYNLTRPKKSLILLAPLSSNAGGYGLCKDKNTDEDTAVFTDTEDPDYQAILDMCIAGKKQLEKIKRFDMPDFHPRPAYVREMKRYGIIPENLTIDTRIDPYEIDRAYWKSLWYNPEITINRKQ